MATKAEKILALLQNGDNDPIISPSSANESEFQATFEGMKDGFYQFSDADGDFWDCDEDEIDCIVLDDGTEIYISDLEDD